MTKRTSEITIASTEIPRVEYELVEDGHDLLLRIRHCAPDPQSSVTSVYTSSISLDNRRVARSRGAQDAEFRIPLERLNQGPHRVQFLVHYRSGDCDMRFRVFNYTGVCTRAPGERSVHTIMDFGSGCVSQRRPELWKVADSVVLPARVTVHCARRARVYLQKTALGTTDFEPPVDVGDDGTAELLLLPQQKYFVVGSHFSGAGGYDLPYDLRVCGAVVEPAGDVWSLSLREPRLYAVVVGINMYLHISNLAWCAADAESWMELLQQKGFTTKLLGDGRSSYAPFVPDQLATEANIRRFIQTLESMVRAGDKVVFATSGHGSGDGKGYSWLCCLDEDGQPDGEYTDQELSQDLGRLAKKGAAIICSVDHCRSGGLGPEIIETCGSENVFLATTCSEAGEGFDNGALHHGEWTASFLVEGLMGRFMGQNPTMGDVYDFAVTIYPHRHIKRQHPMQFGNREMRLV